MWRVLLVSLLVSTGTLGEEKGKSGTEKPDEEATKIEGYFFQDIFSEQLAPLQVQFGHVFENPRSWEQRFEEQDFARNRFKGKVKWGDENGAYGESYWDLNH